MTNPTPPSNTDQNKGFWRSLILWAVLALFLRWYVVDTQPERKRVGCELKDTHGKARPLGIRSTCQ